MSLFKRKPSKEAAATTVIMPCAVAMSVAHPGETINLTTGEPFCHESVFDNAVFAPGTLASLGMRADVEETAYLDSGMPYRKENVYQYVN